MRISDLIKMGLRNLGRRKARTALTIVGVVIGTISIVVMISLGIGLDKSFEQSMMQYGSITSLNIYQNGWVEDEDGNYSETNQENLMSDDFVETLRQIEHVKCVTPIYETQVQLYGNGWMCYKTLRAFDFSVLDALDPPKPVEGTYESVSGTHKILMGKEGFWNRIRPKTGKEVTQEIDFSKERFSMVVDAVASYTQEGMSMYGPMGEEGSEQTNVLVKQVKKEMLPDYVLIDDMNSYEFCYCMNMDIKYYKEVFEHQVKALRTKERKQAMKQLDRYSQILVIVDNVNNVEAVADVIRGYGAQPEGLGSYLQEIKNTARVIEMVLGGIGAVSMLVSAISIANTMIMSIYERTKEIGVMKVLGCVVTDIKKLFLLEAGTIGLIGGAIGIGLSYLLSFILNNYLADTFNQAMQMGIEEGKSRISIIPIWLTLLALAFAFLVGVISGYIPARRATKISAIEAMKSDG